MKTPRNTKRLPRSIRTHLRRQKALLRSTLSPAEAERAVEQLMRGTRRSDPSSSATASESS